MTQEEQRLVNILTKHRQKLINSVQINEGTGCYPRDCVTTYTLEKEIEGIRISISWQEATDRDGEDLDPVVLSNEIIYNGNNFEKTPVEDYINNKILPYAYPL